MKTRVKKTLVNAKNHVKNHKTEYVLGAIAASAIALQQYNVRSFYAFLANRGIDPTEYYCPEYYEELKNS